MLLVIQADLFPYTTYYYHMILIFVHSEVLKIADEMLKKEAFGVVESWVEISRNKKGDWPLASPM